MPPLPKWSRISGVYCFGKREQKSGEFAISQEQEISPKSGVSWDCARTTEDLSTGLAMLLLHCTGWRIWSLSLIGLLNVMQPWKDWRIHYALVLFCRILVNQNRCCIVTGAEPGSNSHRVLQQRTFQTREELLCYEEGVVGDCQDCWTLP